MAQSISLIRGKWHHLYFLLAAFDIFTICLSLIQSHRHLEDYSVVLNKNTESIRTFKASAELLRRAQVVNAPGNDVFDSHDVAKETARYIKANHEFETQIAVVRNLLKDSLGSNATSDVERAMDRMREVATQIFQHFQHHDAAKAGALMAEMDRRYAKLLASIEALRDLQLQSQLSDLETRRSLQEYSRNSELIMGLLVLLAVLGVAAYGSRMSRFVRLALELDQKNGQLVKAINSSAIVALIDRSGKILEVNENFSKISGYQKNELIGQDYRILNYGTHSADCFNDLWKTISDGRVWSGDIVNSTKQGTLYHVRTVITPIKDVEGNIEQFMEVRFDISPQKEMEASLQLERAKTMHNAKLASLGEMSAGIAHEINNPLTVIIGNIPLLDRYKSDDEKFISKLDAVSRSAERIAKIVKGLRKFARSTDGNVHKPESLNTIIAESLVITEAKSKRHSTPISVEISSEIQIHCDNVEIEQVLVNLINNGIDAVKDLAEKWIKIQVLLEQNHVVLRVIDSGGGISEEIEQKLFQPFFTTKDVGEGTGLGLSIAKGILDNHKATLGLNRTFDNTCFEIRFRQLTR